VLLVDDEWLVRWSLERHLVRLGVGVTTASNAGEALAAMRKLTFDWLLTDLKMPDSSGFDVITEARRIQPSLRYILMTAYGSPTVAENARKMGVHYLTKPFDLDDVVEIILPETKKAS
jgi:DNA-binding NtrC family response regulator